WQGHQTVGHVAERPHRAQLGGGADEHHQGEHDAERHHRFPASQVLHAALTVVAPADQGGEGEEHHRERHGVVAERRQRGGDLPQAHGHAQGGHQGAVVLLRLAPGTRDDDDQAGHAHHDDGVDESLGHRHEGLPHRLLRLGGRRSDTTGAQTRLIGEDAAGHTLLDGEQQRRAEQTARGRLAGERLPEDESERRRKLGDVHDEDGYRDEDVGDDHDGHHTGGEPADALDAAQHHRGHDEDHGRTGEPGGDRPDVLQLGGHRVGLGHVADTERGNRAEQGEEEAEDETEAAADPVAQVEHGATALLAFGVPAAVLHTQQRFAVLGGHAQQAGHPHPEQCAGAAVADGERRASDVAHTHGGGQRGAESLVVGDVAFAALLLAAHKSEPQRVAEQPELQSAKPDSQEDSRDEQERDQNERSPNNVVD